MEIQFDNRSGQELALDEYERFARFVLEQEKVPETIELSISLVEEEEMRVLNKAYRSIDAPTDVLSFEMDEVSSPRASGEPLLLGEIVIAPAQAAAHAEDFDSDFASEMRLLLAHGILHLLGYDHISEEEAARMEARETQLCAQKKGGAW